jgi:hypothetical protein
MLVRTFVLLTLLAPGAASPVSAQGQIEKSLSGSTQKAVSIPALPVQNEAIRLLGMSVVYHDLVGVRRALDRGIDINNQFVKNALGAASGQGDLEIAQLLLERGVAQGDRSTLVAALLGAMTNARSVRHLEIMEALIDHGADVNWRDKDGNTLLMFAYAEPVDPQAKPRGSQVQKTAWSILLAHGASVNAKSDNGSTALMLAATNGSLEMIRALLAHGANVNATTDNGYTALSLAKGRRSPEVIDLLKKAGARE